MLYLRRRLIFKKKMLCTENKLKKNSPKCYKNVKTNQCNRE